MIERIRWDAEAAAYIRSRSQRYPAGTDVEPEWTQEVMADTELLAFEPDPKSRMGASRFIGYSSSAGRVIVVIAHRDLDGDLHGRQMPGLRQVRTEKLYEQGDDDGPDD